MEKRKQKGGTDKRSSSSKSAPQLSQEECLENLRKFVGMAPIAGIQKQTLVNITKVKDQRIVQGVTSKFTGIYCSMNR